MSQTAGATEEADVAETQAPEAASLALTPADEQIRSAAKWLLAAFAGLFAFVAGGWQLGALVQVGDARQPVAAVVAVGCALLACASMILFASSILVDLGLTLDDLLEREVRAKLRLEQSEAPGQLETVLDHDPLLKAIDGQRSLMHAGTASPSRLRDAIAAARQPTGTPRELTRATEDLRSLLIIANRIHYSARFSRLVRVLLGALILVLFSVGLYSWAAVNDNPDSVAITEPTAGQLYLDDGVEARDHGFGLNCSARQFAGVIVGGTLEEPVFVKPPSSGCNALQIVITDSIGVFVPETGR